MISANELLARAREYRENIAPQGASRSSLSHEEEFHLLQMKFRIVDRLAKDNGSSFDDHQVFSVAVTSVTNAVAETLEQDFLLEAVFTDVAASVELACRAPISDVQLGQLSRAIHTAGDLYFRGKCFVHAATCYGQSQRGFHKMDAFDEARGAEYMQRLSMWRSRRSVVDLFNGFWSYVLAGFGFRPYRMIWGALAVIVACGLIYHQLTPAPGVGSALFTSLCAYFGILGKSDIIDESVAVRSLIIIESFLALLLNATLVALLAKRWFRL